jgi:WD40 repeat protein
VVHALIHSGSLYPDTPDSDTDSSSTGVTREARPRLPINAKELMRRARLSEVDECAIPYEPNRGSPVSLDTLDEQAHKLQAASAKDDQGLVAFEDILQWVNDPDSPPIYALLGEYGMGKTTTSQRVFEHLRTQHLRGELARPALYFDLRKVERLVPASDVSAGSVPSLQETVEDCLKNGYLSDGLQLPSYADVINSVDQGALVIFDGLDEVLSRIHDKQGLTFTSNLLRVLADAKARRTSDSTAPPPKLLLSCRTQFFRSLREQNNHLTGEHRGAQAARQYRAVVLRPFTEQQIRTYLQAALPYANIQQLMDRIASVHNLSDLSKRPFTLKLVSRFLPQIERWQAEGRKVTGATLYREVAREWLIRDKEKQSFQPEDKERLAAALAAHLWQQKSRGLSAPALEAWLGGWLLQQPVGSDCLTKPRDLLQQDLRNATFLRRIDDKEASSFEFSHSSLQEFFLAEHLATQIFCGMVAPKDTALQARLQATWDGPAVSDETLDFIGQILGEHPHPEGVTEVLNAWRKNYRPQASELLLRYALKAPATVPRPILAGFNLRGANLRGYAFGSHTPVKGAPLLSMQSCNFAGADLRDASFLHVRLDNADFSHSLLQRAAFQRCSLRQVKLDGVQLSGTVFRHCDLHGSDMSLAASHHRCQLVACSGLEPSPMPSSYLRPPEEQPLDSRSNTHLEFFPPNVSAVHCVALSPDGKWMVSGSDDAVLRVWDTVTGEVLLALGGHNEKINCVTISPNGDRIVSGSDDNTLRVWDAASGVALFTLEGHEDEVTSVAFSPTADVIVSGSDDYTLRFWNASTGAPIQTVGSGIGNHVLGLAFSRDGTRIASADCKRAPSLRDAVTGEHVMQLEEGGADVSCVRFSPDGKYVAAGSSDHLIRIWDITTGAVYLTLRGHSGGINSVDYSPDGLYIVSGSSDRTLRVWNAATGELVRTHEGHGEYVMSVACSPNGIQIVSASHDGSLRVWDAFTDESPIVIKRQQIYGFDFSFGGKHILTWTNNGSLKLLDIETGRDECVGRDGRVDGGKVFTLSQDGSRLAVATTEKGILIRNTADGDLQRVLPNDTSLVSSLTFSPDGSRIASCSDDRMLRVWDVATGTVLFSLQSDHDTFGDVLFSPDGTHVAACDIKSQYILDLRTGQPLKKPAQDEHNFRCLAISSQGSRIAVSAHNWSVSVLDVVSGLLLNGLKGEHGMVSCAEFSLDGKQLVTGSVNGVLQVWDTSSGESLHTLRHQGQSILRVRYSSDGLHIVSQSMDGNVRQWDASSGNCVSACWISPWGMPEGHAAWIPPGTESHAPGGRVISASGESWRVVAWQTWGYPGAPGRWTRLPLGAYPVVSA